LFFGGKQDGNDVVCRGPDRHHMCEAPTLEQWGLAVNTVSVELAPSSNVDDATLCHASKLEGDLVN